MTGGSGGGGSDGGVHWTDPGLSSVEHVMRLREVSGGGMERRPIDRGVFAALRYAKTNLPATHPLAQKGWKRMPGGMHTLPRGEGADPAVYADSSDEEM